MKMESLCLSDWRASRPPAWRTPRGRLRAACLALPTLPAHCAPQLDATRTCHMQLAFFLFWTALEGNVRPGLAWA